VTIDGAHNPAAAKSLRDSLENSGKFDLIVGFNADKDWPAILQHLLALARRVWAVPVRSPRSLDPHRVADHVGDHMKFSVRDSFESAYQQGRAAGATDILVAGSLFLAGEARAVITGHDLSEVGGSQ
jgi:dihydrofolate synthase/folylpolyglutamate synthase